MTNEEFAQALIVVAAGAIGGYFLYREFSRGTRVRLRGYEPAFEGAWDDEPELEDEWDEDEGEESEVVEPELSPWREHGARAGSFAMRAGKSGWGYAREKAPVIGAYAKRAGGWAGEGVKSAYEASRRYDYRGAARRLGAEGMKVGAALDELSYMKPAPAVTFPPSVQQTQVMDAWGESDTQKLRRTDPAEYARMEARVAAFMAEQKKQAARQTVFGEPAAGVLKNRRRAQGSRKSMREERREEGALAQKLYGSPSQKAAQYWARATDEDRDFLCEHFRTGLHWEWGHNFTIDKATIRELEKICERKGKASKRKGCGRSRRRRR